VSVELFNASRIQVEQQARIQRRETLRDILREISLLIVNTGNDAKALAALQLAQALVDPELSVINGNVLQLPSKKDEPATVRAEDVARYKAETARHEYIEEYFPELKILLTAVQIALRNDNDQLLQQLMISITNLLHGKVFVGKDVNAFVNGVQHHKLERRYGVILPEFAYEELRRDLYETYVFPENGVIKVTWEIASVYINGKTRGAVDWVEVVSLPLDRELVDHYLAKAVQDGKVLSSNTHIAAFEMLCEHTERMLSIALVSKEMLQQGYTIAHFRQSPKPELLAAAKKSIKTNVSVYVQ